MKKLIIILILTIIPLSVFSSNFNGYQKDNYLITLRVPFNLPVALWNAKNIGTETSPSHWRYWSEMGYRNNVEYGVEVGYDHFLNSKMSLGGLLGYHFAYDRGDNIISKVPFLVRFGYYPLQGRFEIPLIVGIGGMYLGWKSYSTATLYLQFETGFSFYFTDSWSVGFRTGINIVPEFKSGNSGESNVSFFVPVVLQFTFRRF